MKRMLVCGLVIGVAGCGIAFAQDTTDAVKDKAVDMAKDKAMDVAKDKAVEAVKDNGGP